MFLVWILKKDTITEKWLSAVYLKQYTLKVGRSVLVENTHTCLHTGKDTSPVLRQCCRLIVHCEH